MKKYGRTFHLPISPGATSDDKIMSLLDGLMVDDLVVISKRHGWRGIYWHTNEDNARARKLYDSYVQSDGHIRYRLKT